MKKDNSTFALVLLLVSLLGWMILDTDNLHRRRALSGSNYADSTLNDSVIEKPSPIVRVDSTYTGVMLYYPPTDSVDLRCFDRPRPEVDSSVVFCCAAAFTGKGPKGHGNIASDHVSSGKRYRGYRCVRNTGALVFYDGSFEFIYKDYSHKLDSAAAHNGAGFAQEMMIHQGKQVKTTRSLSDENLFRAICVKNGVLCIADATESKPFGSFIESLLQTGVSEALYVDMGEGWNYSWYRHHLDSQAVYIQEAYIETATNWLVFYAKR